MKFNVSRDTNVRGTMGSWKFCSKTRKGQFTKTSECHAKVIRHHVAKDFFPIGQTRKWGEYRGEGIERRSYKLCMFL